MSPSSDGRLGRAPRSHRARLSCRRGQAAVELALVAPILLMLFVGIIEFGRAFETVQALSGLSREGANLAGRGTELDDAVAVTMANGQDISLATRGGVIASRVARQANGMIVEDQIASSGYGGRSRYGAKGGVATGLVATNFTTGQTIHIVEVFYRFSTVTPFTAVTRAVLPQELYERTVF
jgi:Flp pilus assembly protein TadG